MMDPMGQEIAFKGIDIGEGFVPCIALGPGQLAKLNFGQASYFIKIVYVRNLT